MMLTIIADGPEGYSQAKARLLGSG